VAAYRITAPTRTAEGYYVRTLGKAPTRSGQLRPKKFTLGRDPQRAELANLRLQQLWNDIERYQRGTLLGGEPAWTDLTLTFADAIRKGQRIQLPVRLLAAGDTRTGPAEGLYWVRQAYPSIVDLLDVPDTPSLTEARTAAAEQAEAMSEAAKTFAEIAEQPQAAVGTAVTVHEAIDACADHVRQTRINGGSVSEWGRKHAESIERLKRSMADVPLDELDFDAIEQAKQYWAARPKSRKTNRPIAIETVRGQMKALRRLVQFLHRSSRYDWVQPPAVEEALRLNYQNLQTRDEIARLKDGVQVWTIEELTKLYGYARDRERVLMLFGLNCGFSHAEIASLRVDELDLDAGTIKRVRGKTRVYGEWQLWPETVEAIRWWRKHHRQGKARQYVLVTERGKELTRQHIANLWQGLLDRIGQSHSDFRRLPFKHLRKTAGQLVREVADGETMAVFHARGQSVASDDMAERYTNRLFTRVFDAQAQVHHRLAPMFAAAIEPFNGYKRGGGKAADPDTQRTILELHERGTEPADIARVVGMSRQGVYRYLPTKRARQQRRVTPQDIEQIRRMRGEGKPLKEIAAAVGCSVATASRHAAAPA